MKTALLFILMMLVLIAPHEFGHFIVAKLCDVQVNEFSIGMGPLLFKKKKGETQYSLRLIPIGGYCAMEGEEKASENPRAYNKKNSGQRIAILLAGVTMNVIIAMLACTIATQISGVPTNTIDEVVKGSPAAISGLQDGDKILKVDGKETPDWLDVTDAVSAYDGEGKLQMTIKRDGEEINLSMVPKIDKESQSYKVGIVSSLSRSPLQCVPYGIELTGTITKEMFHAIGTIFDNGLHKDDVSGPVGLVKVVGEASSAGASSYLILLALVSLNLALINLLPIPGLDGGKLLFIILKIITFGKINDEMEQKASMIGLVLLLGLFAVVTINDVMNLF